MFTKIEYICGSTCLYLGFGVSKSCDRITPPMNVTALLPWAPGSSFQSTGCSQLSPWLNALIHSDWLAFPLRGKTGRRGVGLPWAGISRSFHTTSHWLHINNVFGLNVEKQAWSEGRKNRKHGSHLLSSLLCHKCNWGVHTLEPSMYFWDSASQDRQHSI